MNVIVKQSTVRDGSMYNRLDMYDPDVFNNRRSFLSMEDMDIKDFVRLRVDFNTDDFCRYNEVNDTHRGEGMLDNRVAPADALVTTTRGLGLFLPVADCIGAVLYDPSNAVVALAHLGRHSLEQHGALRIVEYLVQTHSTRPSDLKIWLTPAAGKDVYKIWKLDNKGMKEAALEQFAKAGVYPHQIEDNRAETTNDPNYYSYSEFLKGSRSDDGDHAIFAMIR